MSHSQAYILYYILPNDHVAVIGVYSSEAYAERANAMAQHVRAELKEEGVTGPFIEEVPFNDLFIADDNFVDIEDIDS